MEHSTSSILQVLLQRSQWLQQMEKLLQETLPVPLNQHCHVMNIRDQTLVIQVDSSIWRARLHYLIPGLIEQWQRLPAFSKLAVIEKVEFRVCPVSPPPVYTASAPPTLSPAASDSLRQVADRVMHTELKTVLLRLANHAADKGCK